MINRLHFGKRLALYRRNLGLLQTELAEMLGVTSQAVSKWECGNAIPDVDLLLELSHMYQVSINEMLEGTDLIRSLTGHETDSDGIAWFVPKKERPCNIGWAEALKEAYRVLKPGGMLVTSTGFVNKETFAKLPGDAKKYCGRSVPIYLRIYTRTLYLPVFRTLIRQSSANGIRRRMRARLPAWPGSSA